MTAAFAVPGLVVAETFQVQDTIPSAPAVGVGFSPAAADTVPDGQVTFAEQTAQRRVCTVMLATVPGIAGLGSERNATNRGGRAVAGAEVAAAGLGDGGAGVAAVANCIP